MTYHKNAEWSHFEIDTTESVVAAILEIVTDMRNEIQIELKDEIHNILKKIGAEVD